ncbi:Hypothetical predicted protein [Mytilus galloprovincialis]|uniref:C2H2-type domain-containing protein n=1 Tax=Mytilus galloprovincialis TaxID=29158 RepID=A0A8B6C4A5_MYTGA|nr:Hypothetical predicted protein [Mytilus galloprovincialis]
MAHAFLETFTVGMDSQTAVAVQSLLESQTLPEPIQATGEEEDVFQCGKCKRQFTTLGAFINHKQSRCVLQRQLSASQNVINHNSLLQAVNRAPQLMQAPFSQAGTLPAYATVSQSPLTQNMVLTDELMSFASVDQTLGASTIQLQQGAALQASGPLLSQVGSFNTRTSNVTILNALNTTSTLPSTSAFTSTVTANQVPLQNVMFTALPEKPITQTVTKPSPTKAGRKSAQASMVNASSNEDPAILRRKKPGETEEKKKLRCQYCDKAFAKNFDLQQHIRAHTGEKPFQCIVCGRAFAQKSNVKKHMSTHKVWPTGAGSTLPQQSPTQVSQIEVPVEEPPPPPPTSEVEPEDLQDHHMIEHVEKGDKKNILVIDNSYICQYCNEKFKSYFQLKTHMIKHKSEQVYKCVQKDCSLSFKDLDAFLQHVKSHENELQYRCHMCNKFFSSLYELGVHQYTHSLYPNHPVKPGPRHFQCTKCMNKYSSPEALEHHMATSSHSHPCPYCEKVFTCERYLRRHLPSHGSEGQFQCTICQKRFKAEHYLKMHQMIHSGEKPFSCQQCGASFNRKDKLKRHMTIHDTAKRFKCPFKSYTGCDKEFNRPDKLKAHIITHSGVRPFECKDCGKTFSRRPHLREHERGHAADYKFKCESCGKGFWRPKTFKDHKCQPLKPGQTRVYVYRHRNRRKVGRPKKRMITVTKDSLNKASEINTRKRRNRTVVSHDQNTEEESQSTEAAPEQDQAEMHVTPSRGRIIIQPHEADFSLKPEQDFQQQMNPPDRLMEGDVSSVDKQDFCVKVIPPENLLNQQYVTVHIQNPHAGQSEFQTHLLPTSTAQMLSSNVASMPITIIETQRGTMLPVHVASVEGATDGDALPLQVTAMSGMGVHGAMVSGVGPCISVEELVPVQVTLQDDNDAMVENGIVVSSAGQHHQQSYVNQLEDFVGSEGDPVLQGTESILKAHAEILQSAHH